MLFDAHTHLNYEMTDEEREALALEIEKSDIKYLIDAGDSLSSSEQAVKDAMKYSWCYAAVGIHPQNASCHDEADLDKIIKLTENDKVKAVGEIGLDFYYGKEDKEEQIELFRKQIRIANKLKMPIMIHTRDANQLTRDILLEEGAFSEERKRCFPKRPGPDGNLEDDARVQFHCYSGSADFAMEYIELGATISLGGAVTFKNGKKTVEVAKAVPIEYLLSETDAPYMAPEPLRGRENKPYYVEHVIRRLALIKNMGYAEAEKVLFENGKRFFNID